MALSLTSSVLENMPSKSRSSKTAEVARKGGTAQIDTLSSLSRKSTSSNNANQKRPPDENLSLVQKVFEPNAELTPQEALAASHWIRQILALVTGIVFGILQLTGFPPIVTFCFLSFSAPFSFLSSLHQLDLDEIKEVGIIHTEGFFPSAALFFLTWIISFTIFFPKPA